MEGRFFSPRHRRCTYSGIPSSFVPRPSLDLLSLLPAAAANRAPLTFISIYLLYVIKVLNDLLLLSLLAIRSSLFFRSSLLRESPLDALDGKGR